MAAATVRISLTLGADRLSRSCSIESSTGSSSDSLNEARTAAMRPPARRGTRHVVEQVVQQIDRRILAVAAPRRSHRAP